MHIYPVTTLITCWRMKLSNNKILCFTDSDQNLTFENELYLSGSHFTPSAIMLSHELGQDQFSINGIIDGEIISESMILAGDFNDAYLEVFLLNLVDSTPIKTVLKAGWIGEIKYSNQKFTADIVSLGNKTNNLIGKCYSASCRAEFADNNCQLELQKYTHFGAVVNLCEHNAFIDENCHKEDGYFSHGILTFTSGLNLGRKFTVREFKSNKFYLESFLTLTINIGDQYSVVTGCDKSIQTCIEKFNNAINFRGEPHLPSQHKLVSY